MQFKQNTEDLPTSLNMASEASTNDVDLSSEEISATTQAVLYFLGLFFVLFLLGVILRLAGHLARRRRLQEPVGTRKSSKARRNEVQAPEQAPPQADPRPMSKGPQKPGISLKQLMKQSAQAASKPQSALDDKVAEHPLYINSLKGHQDTVTGISFSPDGCWLATACDDRVLRVFRLVDFNAKTFVFKRRSLQYDPVGVAFGSSSEVFLISRGSLGGATLEGNTFRVVDKGESLQPGWEVADVHGKDEPYGLRGAVSPAGHGLCLTFSAGTSMQVYDARGNHLGSIDSGGLQQTGAAFSRDGRFFGAATFTSDVKIYEVNFNRQGDFQGIEKVMDLKRAHTSQVSCLAFSPDSTQAVTASKDGTIALWNIAVRYQQQEDPKILLKRDQETPGGERYRHLAFGPGGILAGVFGTTLHFLDAKRGTVLEIVEEAHNVEITAIEWAPVLIELGGRKTPLLATAGLDRRVRLWRAPLL